MYVNNANLNKRLAWTGRTTKDQVDEQFQNRETNFFPQILTGQWTAIPLTSQIRTTQFSTYTKSLRYLFKTPSLHISLYTQIHWSLLSPPWKKDIACQNWRLYCDVKRVPQTRLLDCASDCMIQDMKDQRDKILIKWGDGVQFSAVWWRPGRILRPVAG